ncbi:MAG: TetR/AcrR family transcriptional regulator [Desulfomicrobium escambiense]|nr:TetR/AcrR family transcriptional regulator [Desulfomicrobium escambiense]
MANSETRKKEIIEAAINLIAESGIQNLTVRGISAKIGVTDAALYRHYKNKTDILLGILKLF